MNGLDQRVQDFVERHVSRRLAMRIFMWRVAWYIRRGQVEGARVEETA